MDFHNNSGGRMVVNPIFFFSMDENLTTKYNTHRNETET